MKGVLLSVESIIAIGILVAIFMFLFSRPVLLPSAETSKENLKLKTVNALEAMKDTRELRKDALNNNVSAIENKLASYLPAFLNYTVVIYDETGVSDVVYNFTNTTNNKAYYRYSAPPNDTDLGTEANETEYGYINSSDNIRWEIHTTGSQYLVQSYKFTIFETNIQEININWEGYSYEEGGFTTNRLYIYNYTSQSWKNLGSCLGSTDCWINVSLTSGFSDYINNSKLTLYVDTNKDYPSSGSLYTDYVEVKVTPFKIPSIEAKDIVTVSYFLAGDVGNYSAREIRVYLWGFE